MIILHASWITNEKKSDCGLFFWAENSKNIMRNTSDLLEPMINQSFESIETKLNPEYSFDKLNRDQFFLSTSKLGKVLSQIDLKAMALINWHSKIL